MVAVSKFDQCCGDKGQCQVGNIYVSWRDDVVIAASFLANCSGYAWRRGAVQSKLKVRRSPSVKDTARILLVAHEESLLPAHGNGPYDWSVHVERKIASF